MIKIDYRFSTKDLIGKNGLGKKELDLILKRAKTIMKMLLEKKEKIELGFANLLDEPELVSACIDLARQYQGKIENVVVLGIGGSALGARTIAQALVPEPLAQSPDKRPKLWVCDNIDPDWLNDLFKISLSAPSLFLVISKSGATAETASQLLYLLKELKGRYGEGWKNYLVVITDPEKGLLRKFAQAHNLKSLPVPEKVGGRYSALSPVGLFPSALIGVELWELIRGAKDMDELCFNSGRKPSPAEILAGVYYQFAHRGRRILVMMPYSSHLNNFSEWFAQLWAESLGKKYTLTNKLVRAGSTPVKALGATDQHSQLQLYLEGPEDKLITFLKLEKFSEPILIPEPETGLEELSWLTGHTIEELLNTELFATCASLAREGKPSITITIPELSAYYLGMLFYLFELVTVICAGLWNVNPFDQPGVELGKQYTYGLMKRPGFEKKAKELENFSKKGKGYIL